MDKSFRTLPIQQVMLLESQSKPAVNCVQWVLPLATTLDEQRLREALQHIVARHPVLSSYFSFDDQHAYQHFSHHVDVAINSKKSFSSDLTSALSAVEHFLIDDRKKGFDATKPYLFRCHLLENSDASCLCIFTFHDALFDSQSFEIFLSELIDCYQDKTLSQATQHFNAVLEVQRTARVDKHYWKALLENVEQPAIPSLPYGATQDIFAPSHWQVEKTLDKNDYQTIKTFCEQHSLSLKLVGQIAWALLLNRYCDNDDIVIGITEQIRENRGVDADRMIGCFYNTLPLCLGIDESIDLESLIEEANDQLTIRRTHPNISVLDALKQSPLDEGSRLLATSFSCEQGHLRQILESKGMPWAECELFNRYASSFDLACNLIDGDGIHIRIDYNVDVFDQHNADQILKHFSSLLLNIAKSDLHSPAHALAMLDANDIAQLQTLNDRASETYDFLAFHQRIKSFAEKTPEQIAIIEGEQSVSYQNLWANVQILAAELTALGITRESVVIIALPQSIRYVTAMLAVLESGAAFLPVDISLPNDRLQFIAEDSAAHVAIVETNAENTWATIVNEVVVFDYDSELANVPIQSSHPAQPEQSAYIIFTSGTTGKPKGVVVEHGQLSNHYQQMSEVIQITRDDHALQFTSTSFDVSIEEICTTLANGASLVIRTEKMLASVQSFVAEVERYQLSILNLPTAFWSTLVDGINEADVGWPSCIKSLTVGGERIESEVFKRFRQQNTQHIRFINGYGPTETTITSTYFVVDDQEPNQAVKEKLSRNLLPIGRPLAGVSHYILDSHKRLMPKGASGELFIAGAGVSRGYLHREVLNANYFLTLNILDQNIRCYASGDGVYLDGDHLIYKGRIDHQMKVRGFRVEPAEIESVITSHLPVKSALVTMDLEQENTLVAFIESSQSFEELGEQLIASLKDQLPSHMVPQKLIFMDYFPITKAGKIDRQGLWQYAAAMQSNNTDDENNLSSRQRALLNLFKDLLKLDTLSIEDSFFEQGGHSLLAVRLFSEIEKHYQVVVPIREFFSAPTVKTLDHLIEIQNKVDNEEEEPAEEAIGSLHTLQANGDGCPVYCICGVNIYQDVAHSLGEDQAVYGIFLAVEEQIVESFRNDQQSHQLPSVEEMATQYVKVIRQNQPFGPYKLMGLSFGGILAYEIAQQLTRSGESVESLVLIDSFKPQIPKAISVQKIKTQLRLMKIHGLGYFSQLARKIYTKLASHLEKYKVSQRLTSGIEENLDEIDFEVFRNLAYREAALNYSQSIVPYDGKITLIHAADSDIEPEGVNSYDHGWEAYAKQGFARFDVPGGHISVLKDNNAKILANNIKADIITTNYHIHQI